MKWKKNEWEAAATSAGIAVLCITCGVINGRLVSVIIGVLFLVITCVWGIRTYNRMTATVGCLGCIFLCVLILCRFQYNDDVYIAKGDKYQHKYDYCKKLSKCKDVDTVLQIDAFLRGRCTTCDECQEISKSNCDRLDKRIEVVEHLYRIDELRKELDVEYDAVETIEEQDPGIIDEAVEEKMEWDALKHKKSKKDE